MREDDFWEFVEGNVTISDNGRLLYGGLEDEIRLLPNEELFDAVRWFRGLHARLYSAELWGAAYLIMGGCSDDAFSDVRTWCVGAGRETYRIALREPDALVGYAKGCIREELLAYKFRDAFERVHGDSADVWDIGLPEVEGDWDFDDPLEMERRLPRLWAKYG